MSQRIAHDDCGQPPVDRAKNFATFQRLKSGYREELRIGIDEYNGYPYVSLRVWVPGENSEMWPKRVGCSLRKNEVIPTIKALQAIADELGIKDEPVKATTALYPPDRRGPRRRVSTAEIARLAAEHHEARQEFNELGDHERGE